MSNQLTGPVAVAAQQIHSSSSDQMHNLGEVAFANDGRAFRYCEAGGTALVAGKLQQSQAEVTGDQDLTAVAAAVGDTQFVSTSTVTVTANEYAEGWVLISVTPGVGRQYGISGHAAFTAAAPTINLSDPIEVALTTTSRADLMHNPFAAVVVSPTTATSGPAGVAVHPVVASEFGWLQVAGVANVLSDGATAVGNFVSVSGSVAGAVIDATHAAEAPVGTALQGIADTEYGAVRLSLL